MIKIIARLIYASYELLGKVIHRIVIMPLQKAMLGSCGKNVILGKKCNFSWKNVHIGNNVSIGHDAMFMCTRARIRVGNNVMFGPHVTMITGGHRIDMVGKYMIDVRENEKLPENDKDIRKCTYGCNVRLCGR